MPAGLGERGALLPGPPYDRFELAHGPENQDPADNKPPHFVHVVLAAGKLVDNAHSVPNPPFGPMYGAFGFRWPPHGSTGEHLSNRLLGEHSRRALRIADVDWNDHRGELVLAPGPSRGGGAWADHLIFLWRSGGVDYALSLHTWTPVNEALATLRAMVRSLPSSPHAS